MAVIQLTPAMTESEERAAQSSNNGYLQMASSLPICSILWLPISTVPTGFKECNGAALLIATYPDLAVALYCGDGNNVTALYGYKCTSTAKTTRSTSGTYIVLPDLRGEFIRAWDDGRGINSGRGLGTAQADDLKAHIHGFDVYGVGATNGAKVASNGNTALWSTANTTSVGGAETRPRNIVLMPIIKVTGFLDSATVIYTKAQIDTYLSGKVDKVDGQGLYNDTMADARIPLYNPSTRTITASCTLLTTDNTILVSNTSDCTIYLFDPALSHGKVIIIKRMSGSTGYIHIYPSYGNIDTSPYLSLPNQYDTVTLQSTGTGSGSAWSIISYTNAMADARINYYMSAWKNMPYGIAGLDPNGDIYPAQLPNNLISDTTYQAAWQSFTMTYDPATGIFTTSIAHPFVLNDPIEFQANGNTLPTGLLPFNSDNIGGTYYNIQSVADNLHFTITNTIGGTLYQPSTVGSGAYQVRLAGVSSFTITGLDLTSDKNYRIEISNFGYALKTASGGSAYIMLNGVTGTVLQTGVQYSSTAMDVAPNVPKKYSMSALCLKLALISSDTVNVYAEQRGTSSNDKSTSITTLNFNSGGIFKNIVGNVTSIKLPSSNTSAALLRNGIQVKVWRLN